MPRSKIRKRKRGTSPPRAVEQTDGDYVLDVGDILDTDGTGTSAEFLTKLKLEELTGKKGTKRSTKEVCVPDSKRARREEQGTPSSDEAEFERNPRTSRWTAEDDEDKGLHHLLPLKEQGRLIQQDPLQLELPGEDSDTSFESSAADEEKEPAGLGAELTPKVLTEAELFLQSEERRMAKREMIPGLCARLMENPEENIGRLKVLRGLCVEPDPEIAVEIRQLAMPAFANLMKDIAPSYHIRELTDAEKAVKVSKDVRRLRYFEQTLLLDYQHFLSQCDDTIKVGLGIKGAELKKRRRERKKSVILLENGEQLSPSDMKGLAEVALDCMCDLLVSLSYFNFRNNILAALVPLMPSGKLQGRVSKKCCAAIENFFRNDSVGDVSFEAVQLIAKMVKSKSYNTKPAVLRTFLQLRLKDVDDPVAAAGTASRQTHKSKEEKRKQLKQKLTKKQKKRLQEEAKLDQDLQEASAVESKEKRSKMQTEVLKVVFLTYFRILKHSRHSPLLGAVLEGLAKFAHLISVDFFADLMSVLHSLAETGGLTNKECMQCVLTAFKILSGQGSALNIDPREFYTRLYGALLNLDARSTDEDVLLAVDCLDKLLRNQRQVSSQRVLGFVKRLATVSLQLSPGASLAVLATIRKFIQSYSQCEQLLDVEAMTGSGVYRPDVPDPEMSCSSSTSLWELADLRLHFDPTVATYAHHLLHGAPSHGKRTLTPELARKTPKELLSEFSLLLGSADFELMAGTPLPLPHPALKLASKGKKGAAYYYKDMGLLSTHVKELAKEVVEVADVI